MPLHINLSKLEGMSPDELSQQVHDLAGYLEGRWAIKVIEDESGRQLQGDGMQGMLRSVARTLGITMQAVQEPGAEDLRHILLLADKIDNPSDTLKNDLAVIRKKLDAILDTQDDAYPIQAHGRDVLFSILDQLEGKDLHSAAGSTQKLRQAVKGSHILDNRRHAGRIAERILHVVNNSKDSVYLVELIRALAAVDLHTASQLAADIKHHAEAADALWGICAFVASTDPDRALSIAHSIADDYYKQRAIASVAETLAPLDPARALDIIEPLEQQYKDRALRAIAIALAPTDAKRAEQILGDLLNAGPSLHNEFVRLAIAQSEPARRSELCAQVRAEAVRFSLIDESNLIPEIMVTNAALMADVDRQQALTDLQVGASFVDWWKSGPVQQVAKQVQVFTPQEIHSCLAGHENAKVRRVLMLAIIKEAAAQHPGWAVSLAKQFEDPYLRCLGLSTAAEYSAALPTAQRQELLTEAREQLAELESTPDYLHALCVTVRAAADLDPDYAQQKIVEAQSVLKEANLEKEKTELAQEALAEALVCIDPNAAIDFVGKMKNPYREAIAQAVLPLLLDGDPSRAINFVNTMITNSSRRLRAYTTILKSL